MARTRERAVERPFATMTGDRTRSSCAMGSRRVAAGWCGQGIVLRDVASSSSHIGPALRAIYHPPGGHSAVFSGRCVS